MTTLASILTSCQFDLLSTKLTRWMATKLLIMTPYSIQPLPVVIWLQIAIVLLCSILSATSSNPETQLYNLDGHATSEKANRITLANRTAKNDHSSLHPVSLQNLREVATMRGTVDHLQQHHRSIKSTKTTMILMSNDDIDDSNPLSLVSIPKFKSQTRYLVDHSLYEDAKDDKGDIVTTSSPSPSSTATANTLGFDQKVNFLIQDTELNATGKPDTKVEAKGSIGSSPTPSSILPTHSLTPQPNGVFASSASTSKKGSKGGAPTLSVSPSPSTSATSTSSSQSPTSELKSKAKTPSGKGMNMRTPSSLSGSKGMGMTPSRGKGRTSKIPTIITPSLSPFPTTGSNSKKGPAASKQPSPGKGMGMAPSPTSSSNSKKGLPAPTQPMAPSRPSPGKGMSKSSKNPAASVPTISNAPAPGGTGKGGGISKKAPTKQPVSSGPSPSSQSQIPTTFTSTLNSQTQSPSPSISPQAATPVAPVAKLPTTLTGVPTVQPKNPTPSIKIPTQSPQAATPVTPVAKLPTTLTGTPTVQPKTPDPITKRPSTGIPTTQPKTPTTKSPSRSPSFSKSLSPSQPTTISPSRSPTGAPIRAPATNPPTQLPVVSPTKTPTTSVPTPVPVLVPGTVVSATPYSVVYVPNVASPTDAQTAQAAQVTCAHVEDYIKDVFALSDPFVVVLDTSCQQVGSATNPTSISYVFNITFADTSDFIPSQADINRLIAISLREPQSSLLINSLSQLQNNPYSGTTSVIYSLTRMSILDIGLRPGIIKQSSVQEDAESSVVENKALVAPQTQKSMLQIFALNGGFGILIGLFSSWIVLRFNRSKQSTENKNMNRNYEMEGLKRQKVQLSRSSKSNFRGHMPSICYTDETIDFDSLSSRHEKNGMPNNSFFDRPFLRNEESLYA